MFRVLRRDRSLRWLAFILLVATASVTVAYALASSSARAAELNAFAMNAGRRYSVEALTPEAQQQLDALKLPRLTTVSGQVSTSDAAVPVTLIAGERANATTQYGLTADSLGASGPARSGNVALSQAAAVALTVGTGDDVTVTPDGGRPEHRRVTRIYYLPLHPGDISVAVDDSAAGGATAGLTRWVATAPELSVSGFPNDRKLIRLSGAHDTGVEWSADIERRQLGFLSFVPVGAIIVALGLWWASALLCAQRWRTSAVALEAMGVPTQDSRRLLATILGVVGTLGAATGIVVGGAISFVGASVLDESLGQRWDRAALDPVRSLIFAAVLAVLSYIVARVVVARDLRVIAPAYVTPSFVLATGVLPLIIGVGILLSAGEQSNGEDAAGTPLRILAAAACLAAAAATLAVGYGGLRRRSQGRAVGKAGGGYARALWPAAATTGLLCAFTAFGAGFATLVSDGSAPTSTDTANSSLVVSQLSPQAATQVAGVWNDHRGAQREAVMVATATSPGQQLLISTPAYVTCIGQRVGQAFADADLGCPVPELVDTNPNRLATQINDPGQSEDDASADIAADPGYIQAGKIGVLILDTKTNTVIATRTVPATPLAADKATAAGGILRPNSATARSLSVTSAPPYDVLLDGFTHLTVQQQARLRAGIAPYTGGAEILEPEASDPAGASAMSWLLADAGLALALAVLLASGATLLSSAGPLRSLMADLGAVRSIRLRLALTALGPFAVAAITGCLAGVGFIHVAWSGIALTSTGWNWALPGIGALAAWTVIVGWFTWGPSGSSQQ